MNERANALSGSGSGGGGGNRRCVLSSIKDEELGHGEKPDWITVRGLWLYESIALLLLFFILGCVS